MRQKILIARAVFADVVERLSQYFEVEANQADQIFSESELAGKLAAVDGALTTGSERVDAAAIAGAGRLKAVCNIAVGYNNIDVEAATRAGIMVTNTPDVLNETTADFGWALMMAAARRVTEAEQWLRAGKWSRWRYDT